MSVGEISNQIREYLEGAGFQVLPAGKDSDRRLFGVRNNTVFVIDYLTNAGTLSNDIDSARYTLSQVKNRLENSNFRVELEQVLLVLFEPAIEDIVILEKARNDLSLTRRRIIMLGSPNQPEFKVNLRDRIGLLTAYGSQGGTLELEPPLDRLQSQLSDRTSRELLTAYRKGGVSEMKKAISVMAESS